MSFFDELKRRNVFRVGIAYAITAWLIMQVTDTFAPALRLPEWFPTAVAFLLLIGLPFALFFAWAFELTPDGLRREGDVDPEQSIKPQTARKLDRMIIVVLVMVVGVLLLDRFYAEEETASEPFSSNVVEVAVTPVARSADGQTSVAVIPFVNMSDDQQNEYFSDGISEELLNVLVRIEGLRVPSRTSSFTFKGSDKNLTEIGHALQVDHILEGSVRKSGDRIRVTAQLIDVRTDTHLWSDTYTRQLDDIFAVQDEIAQAIVEALKLTLSVGDKKKLADHSTNNVKAYNQYLLGRHLWNQRSSQSLAAAIKPLREAVEMDPQFDQAWAALADVYVILPEYKAGSVEKSISLARSATQRALAINPDSARALSTSGYYKAFYDYDWEGANSDFLRAIEIEPGYATGHQWYAEALGSQGQIEEALQQTKLAAKADPLSAVIRHTPGYLLLYTNRLDEAEAVYRSTCTQSTSRRRGWGSWAVPRDT